MRTPQAPPGARRLRTYAEFESYLQDFVEGIYTFLWVVGRPGLGKTESIKAALRGQPHYHRNAGQLTPAQFYIDCFQHRCQPIILDDVEQLLRTPVGQKLISALGDTTPAKLLCYGATGRGRFMGDVPQQFSTTSPLCILANHATAHEALQSRALTLLFDPTNGEVHRAAAAWFWDQEVHDWFGKHLHCLQPLDVRWYGNAARDKLAGRDWQQILLATHGPDRVSAVVQDLEHDSAYPTREDKARRFLELLGPGKGASRASYFRQRRRLEEQGRLTPDAVAPIPLRRTRPPGVPSLLELEQADARPTATPEEQPGPQDVPGRATFAEPIRGPAIAQPRPSSPPSLVAEDGLTSWERTRQQDEDDAE